MYFLYLDESGVPNGWQDQNHFILGGVAVHEGQVAGLANKLDDIQESYFGSLQIPIEFHAGDMKSGNGRWRKIQEETRERMLNEVYDVIGSAAFPTLVAFATALHISKAIDSETENIRATFEDVCLRFNTFLMRQHKWGNPNKGLLIIDDAHRKHYKDLINTFRRDGVKGTYIGNIVDIPYFSASQETRMLQLVDFCSYAVYRYYEKDDSTYLNKILSRFDRRDKFHPADGLKHMTKIFTCECLDCSWRRTAKPRQLPTLGQEPDAVEPFGTK